MTAAIDLLASGLGSLRRLGLVLAAAGVALVVLLVVHPSSDAHHVDGGSGLRLATTTVAAP